MSRLLLVVHNDTNWNGRDLRRLLVAGLRSQGVIGQKAPWYRGGRIDVTYRRASYVGGYGYYNSARLALKIPHAWKGERLTGDRLTRVAQVLIHEVQHTLGFRHKDMAPWHRYPVKWARGIEVKWNEPRPKPAVSAAMRAQETVAKRAEHAEKMLKRAETRLKRAKTLRDKWAKKVRYYNKRRKEQP